MEDFGIVAKVVAWLLSQGWPGLVTLVFGGLAGFMFHGFWMELKECRKQNKALQEARVADARKMATDTAEGLASTRAAIHILTDLIRDRRERRQDG